MLNWFSQVFSVTLFNLRTIPERKGAAIAAAVGIAGVVPAGILPALQAMRLSIADALRRQR